MRLALAVVVLAGAALGCRPHVEIDAARLTAAIAQKADRVLARPDVDRAMNQLVAAISDDAEVGASGQRIFAKLGEDPELAAGADAIINGLSEHPATKKLLRKLAAENPRARADELPALFEARFNAVASSPAFDQAFDKAFARVIDRPDVAAAVHRLERAATANPDVSRVFETAARSGATDAAVSRRLIALNGGARPDPARAADLFAEHAFSDDRIAQFYTTVFVLPAVTSKIAGACHRLLDAPAFQAHLARALRRMVADKGFQQAAIAALVGVLENPKSEDGLERALEQLLGRPVVGGELAKLVGAVIDDPALAPIGNDAIGGVVGAPAFRDSVTTLLGGW